MFKFFISPNDVEKFCRWLTGNLDSVGKFRLASYVSPDDLNIAKYHSSSYIDNIENQKELDEALSRLTSKKPAVKKLLFKGMPMIGKTRAVYEKVIKKLDNFLVFFPSPVELGKVRSSEIHPMPGKRGLILFLDDLDRFVVRQDIDLRHLISRLQGACPKLLVVAALRTGVEMTDKVMAERHGRELLQDFLEIDFRNISSDEARQLAQKIGKTQYEFDDKTPGSVVLGLEEMKYRLESLGTNERAVCKTLKLLYFAFQPNPEKELIETVSDAVFNTNFKNQRMNWDDCIKKLRENDLIKDLGMFITAPHGDFYFCVYDSDYNPTQDLFKLKDTFGKKRDALGLVSLGCSLAALLGRHEEAIESYDKALEVDPKDALALVNKGVSLAKLGKHEEAIESYDKALEVDPKDAPALVNKGASLTELGRHEDAIKSYDKALEVDPKDALALVNKGASLAELGRHEEALKSFDKALEIDPKYASVWYNKGNSFAKFGRHEEALESFNKAIEIDPKCAPALVNKGASLTELGRHEEAIKSCDEAIKIDPKYASAWYNKGGSLAKLGRHEEALKSFDKALEIDPKYARALVNKGVSLAELGRHEEAIESYDKALEIDPKDALAWYNKGNSFAKLGKHEEAIESYDKALEIDPSFLPAWHNKDVCLREIGRIQEAEECFKREREIIEKLKSVLDERPKS